MVDKLLGEYLDCQQKFVVCNLK